MADSVDAVAQAIFEADPAGAKLVGRAWTEVDEWERNCYRKFARAAIDALGLTEEHQWVPVQSDGHRWEPRSEGLANAAYALYRRGGHAHNAALDYPIDHIEHEVRLVSGWVGTEGQHQ